jgi:membrane-bound lytic murein transglycosylase MltF
VRIVRQYAARYRVPPELIAAFIDVESRWNPQAVSAKGAMGLMQLMPARPSDLAPFSPLMWNKTLPQAPAMSRH